MSRPSGWWDEPRSDSDRRMEMLTGKRGGGRRGFNKKQDDRISLLTGSRSSTSDDNRRALLTGSADDDSRRSLLTGSTGSRPSASDRMKLLTGSADPRSERRSVYGGREEYDPQDRAFNQQFSEAPRGPQPWDNDGGPHSRPSTPISRPSTPISRPSSPFDDGGPHSRPSTPDVGGPDADKGPSPTTSQVYDDSSIRERIRALEGRPQTGGWQEDRIKALEDRPQSTGGGWQEDRIKALENRKPIVNQSTVDLSGVEGRLSQLEGKGSDWQEDRVAALEGRKPQDLSGLQGRLTDLEGRQDDTSWKDQLSEGTTARDLLSKRVASLEDYYKNDPPLEESTGNRYEDKMADLVTRWDMTDKATKWDKTDDRLSGWGYDHTGKHWADALEEGYVQGVRNLNQIYNKPIHTDYIKGREYKAYDPRAAARLRALSRDNKHEDEFLGKGQWQNQYGEEISGSGFGHEDRYFTSQSGLDLDSQEYKDRFGSSWASKGNMMGKDWSGAPEGYEYDQNRGIYVKKDDKQNN